MEIFFPMRRDHRTKFFYEFVIGKFYFISNIKCRLSIIIDGVFKCIELIK